MEYRYILVALDLTEDSLKVAGRAAELARHYGSRITLLHVVEPVPFEAGGEAIIPPTVVLSGELRENAERRLAELAGQAGLQDVERRVVTGFTKQEILDHAKTHDADLIVVGSHGRHGLALLLGSTANAVLHGAPCDVLAVRV